MEIRDNDDPPLDEICSLPSNALQIDCNPIRKHVYALSTSVITVLAIDDEVDLQGNNIK